MAASSTIQKYEYIVYDQKQAPPSLMSFMWIFFGFDLAFHVFMLVLLSLSSYLFKSESNAFPVDNFLLTKFTFDYLVSTLVIMVVGVLIGNIIREKKYFRYKHEGQRGIRAFAEIMKTVSTSITMLPLFMLNPF
jgi:hypothetical protein